jgi:periplasmic protein TonB
MFEDSLVESTGRFRTRTSRLAIGSFLLQAAILGVLILIPYLYPAALPRQALSMLLTAPPPPPAPANLPAHVAPSHAAAPATLVSLTMPSSIPVHAAMIADAAPSVLDSGLESSGPSTPGDLRKLFGSVNARAPKVVVEAKPKSGPPRISAGVAEGRLLNPIRPVYPAIAKAARIQGTVIVEATISKTGAVINAHTVSGPPMLVQAAITAIAAARYQPYKLNGEPVEVETTINVVFTLN